MSRGAGIYLISFLFCYFFLTKTYAACTNQLARATKTWTQLFDRSGPHRSPYLITCNLYYHLSIYWPCSADTKNHCSRLKTKQMSSSICMAATNLKVQHIVVSTKVYISVPVVLIINQHIVTRLVASRWWDRVRGFF